MTPDSENPASKDIHEKRDISSSTPLVALIEQRLEFQDPSQGDVLKIIADNFGDAERNFLVSRGYEVIEIHAPEDIAEQRIWDLISNAQRISQQGLSIERDTTLPHKVVFVMTTAVNDTAMLDPNYGTALRRELGGNYSWTIRESDLDRPDQDQKKS